MAEHDRATAMLVAGVIHAHTHSRDAQVAALRM